MSFLQPTNQPNKSVAGWWNTLTHKHIVKHIIQYRERHCRQTYRERAGLHQIGQIRVESHVDGAGATRMWNVGIRHGSVWAQSLKSSPNQSLVTLVYSYCNAEHARRQDLHSLQLGASTLRSVCLYTAYLLRYDIHSSSSSASPLKFIFLGDEVPNQDVAFGVRVTDSTSFSSFTFTVWSLRSKDSWEQSIAISHGWK